jgi:acetyl esterase/lipase
VTDNTYRKPTGRSAKTGLWACVVILVSIPAYAQTPPPGFVFKQDLAYGAQSDRQKLDILYPESSKTPLPAIVHIHGGGWYTGGKGGDKTFQLLSQYAEAGYVGVSIAYRFSDEAKFPAAVHDCKLAVRWLRAHASDYGIDPRYIGAIGASAGGHLAAMLAVTTQKDGLEGSGGCERESSEVQAAVAVCAPLNLTVPLSLKLKDQDDPLVVQFLGGSLEAKQSEARRASPIFYVNASTPPIFFLHGTADKRVDPYQSVATAEAMRRVGAPCQLTLVEGGIHGMDIARDEKGVAATLAFFNSHLKPAPAP